MTEITIKTPSEGEITRKIQTNDDEFITWEMLVREYLNCLRGLGYQIDNSIYELFE